MRLAGYEPLVEYPGSKIPWKCRHLSCGEIVSPLFNKVQQGGGGCNVCSGKKRIDPVLARKKMIAAGMKPMVPFPGKDKKWKCICKSCGKIRYTYYSSIRDGRTGCKPCALQKNAILKRIPKDKVFADYRRINLEPIEEYINTGAPLKCKCLKCGNFPSPTYTAVRSGIGCRYCSEKLTSPAKARSLAEKAGLYPLEDFVNGQIPWKCKHLKCGEIVFPLFATILKGHSGCVSCNSKTAALKYRFSDEAATAIMIDAGFQPLAQYVNAVSRWKSKCLKCGNIVYPTLANVKNGSGCIYCADVGFNLLQPAYFYLMFHPEMGSTKVGIGGKSTRNDRISTHRKYGWELYKSLDLPTGEFAYELEQEILKWLRIDLGFGNFLLPELMPQGGHTETVDASEIDLPTIWAKVEGLSRVNI
jgi:formylmethanofuran dehydrogenase subunit E